MHAVAVSAEKVDSLAGPVVRSGDDLGYLSWGSTEGNGQRQSLVYLLLQPWPRRFMLQLWRPCKSIQALAGRLENEIRVSPEVSRHDRT